MVDIIKAHLKPIIAAAILIALMGVILLFVTPDGVASTAFKDMLLSIFSKGLDAGGF